MRFKKMALALLACMALAAVATSGAQAHWTVKTAGNNLTAKESVKISGSGLTLKGELLSKALTLEATGISCAEVVANECTIDNELTVAGTPDHSEGKLKFTGVKVVSPANCTVRGLNDAAAGTVTTNKLTDMLWMHKETGIVYDEFFTDSGPFATLVFSGATCAYNELEVPVNGTVDGWAVKSALNEKGEHVSAVTGELAKDQPLTFSETLQKTFGGLLYLNNNKEKPAYIAGTVHNELSGKNAGEVFGADE